MVRSFVLYMTVDVDLVDDDGNSHPTKQPQPEAVRQALHNALGLFNASDMSPENIQLEGWLIHKPIPKGSEP